MNKPVISIIAAIGKNRELGKDNKLLWHIPEDLIRFKKLTSGHVVIMGRKTYQSIGRPLPNRTNIIITRDINFSAPGSIITHSLDEALEIAKQKEKEEIFVIGGGQIYNQAINLADKLYLTLVDGTFAADTYFPNYSRFKKVLFKKKGITDSLNYKFIDLIP
ncbi:dihydrofolate reductase [Candidatus Gottesmanbacteria bacterium]|nr:dihydrofolate reductase [Candidatus Gottesmanbacteria bacterium]